MIEELLSAARQGDGDAIRNLRVTTAGRPDCRPPFPPRRFPIQISPSPFPPRPSPPRRLPPPGPSQRAHQPGEGPMTGAGPLHLAAESGSVEATGRCRASVGGRRHAMPSSRPGRLRRRQGPRGGGRVPVRLGRRRRRARRARLRPAALLRGRRQVGRREGTPGPRSRPQRLRTRIERIPRTTPRSRVPKDDGAIGERRVGYATRRDERARHDGAERGGGTQRAAAAEVLAAAGAAVGAEHGDGLARLLRGTERHERGGPGWVTRGSGRETRGPGRSCRYPGGRFDQTPGGGRGWRRGGRIVTGYARAAAFPFLVAVVLGGLHLRRRCTARRAAGRPARATSRGTGVGRAATAGGG